MAEVTGLRFKRMQVVMIAKDSKEEVAATRQHADLDIGLGRNSDCGVEVGQISPGYRCTNSSACLSSRCSTE